MLALCFKLTNTFPLLVFVASFQRMCYGVYEVQLTVCICQIEDFGNSMADGDLSPQASTATKQSCIDLTFMAGPR